MVGFKFKSLKGVGDPLLDETSRQTRMSVHKFGTLMYVANGLESCGVWGRVSSLGF